MMSQMVTDGGDGSFDAFCTSEYPRLVAAVGLYCGDRDVAEDVAQEALTRAYSRWETVSAMAHPSAWVQRVAMNLATSHFRWLAMRRRRDQGAPVEHVDPDTAGALAVREALLRLEPRARQAVVLRYYLDYSVAQTAAVIGAPENTVKTLVRRALIQMGPFITEEAEAERHV